MSFINNKQFLELRQASKGGNAKAKAIIEKFMQNGDSDSISRLIDDYYNSNTPKASEPQDTPLDNQAVPAVPNVPEENGLSEKEEAVIGQGRLEDNSGSPEMPESQEATIEDVVSQAPSQEAEATPADISGDLDKELDGLIDEDDIDSESFDDFLSNKKKGAMRAKKNHDYFSAFDPVGRGNYLTSKKDEYSHKFDVNRQDIDRSFRDMDSAIGSYSQFVSDQPDDENESNMDMAGSAYDGILDSVGKSHSFGRSWDEGDMQAVKDQLSQLIAKFGKKNVLAALNLLKGDNEAYRDHRVNSIDKAVKDYGGKLDELLK